MSKRDREREVVLEDVWQISDTRECIKGVIKGVIDSVLNSVI